MSTNPPFFDIDGTEDVYVLVLWPHVQDLMEYDWFRQECYLLQAFDDQNGHDSAYFVPMTRIMEVERIQNNCTFLHH